MPNIIGKPRRGSRTPGFFIEQLSQIEIADLFFLELLNCVFLDVCGFCIIEDSEINKSAVYEGV